MEDLKTVYQEPSFEIHTFDTQDVLLISVEENTRGELIEIHWEW